MCIAITKAGTSCRVKKNLVDGLCHIHRPKDAAVADHVCDFVLVRGKNKGRACGQKADESLRCKKHQTFSWIAVVLEDSDITAAFGPYKTKIAAEQATSLMDHVRIVKMEPYKSQSKSKVDEEEKEPCGHIMTRGKRKGETCGKPSITGEIYCSRHAPADAAVAAVAAVAAEAAEETDEKEDGCSHVLKNGPRKGEECGRKVSQDGKCAKHKEQLPAEDGCDHILTKGVRKGEECGKKIFAGTKCKTHAEKDQEYQEEDQEVAQEYKEDAQETAAEELEMELEKELEEATRELETELDEVTQEKESQELEIETQVEEMPSLETEVTVETTIKTYSAFLTIDLDFKFEDRNEEFEYVLQDEHYKVYIAEDNTFILDNSMTSKKKVYPGAVIAEAIEGILCYLEVDDVKVIEKITYSDDVIKVTTSE